MELNIVDIEMDKDKYIDFNHIEYIKILVDNSYTETNTGDVKIKKGDIISFQYVSRKEIIIKLNDKKLSKYSKGIHWEHGDLYWYCFYWDTIKSPAFSRCKKLVFRYTTKEIERDNKLKKLL